MRANSYLLPKSCQKSPAKAISLPPVAKTDTRSKPKVDEWTGIQRQDTNGCCQSPQGPRITENDLRSFPNHSRNCQTLGVFQAKPTHGDLRWNNGSARNRVILGPHAEQIQKSFGRTGSLGAGSPFEL